MEPNEVRPLYEDLEFPDPPAERPYIFVNMVATIDGKTVSGTNLEPVGDLGSDKDHAAMRAIELASDGILIGAGNLRSTPKLWFPAEKIRCVATVSGDVDYRARFFTDAPENAFVICPPSVHVPTPFHRLPNDFPTALLELRTKHRVRRLLIEGGSEINAEFFGMDVVDELFLTIAPKIKLGRCLPTYAGGEPLARNRLLNYDLVEHRALGSEIFLRYRRKLES